MEPSFSGYVTKADLKCADGRTIARGAFAHQDGMTVPLVYQHNHDDVEQVLGHVILSKRDDGIWGDAYLNESVKAGHAKAALANKDLDKLSVWAKDLDERPDYTTKQVMVHDGTIQEVSLVLAGANPGAIIHNVMAHSVNGVLLDPDEDLLAVTGEIFHDDVKPDETPKPDDKPTETPKPDEKPAEGGKTQGEVLDSLTDEQRTAVNQFIEDLAPQIVAEALTEEPELTHGNVSSKKGNKMTRNLFDQSGKAVGVLTDGPEIKHSDMEALLHTWKGKPSEGLRGFNESGVPNGSLRDFVRSAPGKELWHADTYGLDNAEVLFPDAQAVMTRPTFVDRRQEWVKTFMNGTSKAPFARIKTMYADITADEARARGYIKGNQKVDEVFPIFKRTTGPAWIYKRQRLDRQDIIDIVSFDVVAWMKAEMRGKLDEELARAGLFGDGRPTMVGAELNPDKILEPTGNEGNGIRSVLNDNDLYTGTYNVELPADPTGADWNILLDTVTESQEHYMGSGNKTAFMTYRMASKLLTIRDDFGHRIYRNLGEVAGDMDVARIERVPTSLMPTDVLCIVLDLADYTFGADRGGQVTLFDDFDINVNQYIYLIETYLSGALTLPYSAQVFKSVVDTSVEITPTQPVNVDNVITIPTQTGVVYKNEATGTTLSQGSTVTLTEGQTLKIEATPTAGYHFESNVDQLDSWNYRYKA